MRKRSQPRSLSFCTGIFSAIRGFWGLSIPDRIVRHKSKNSAEIIRRTEMLNQLSWGCRPGEGENGNGPNGPRRLCSRGGTGRLFRGYERVSMWGYVLSFGVGGPPCQDPLHRAAMRLSITASLNLSCATSRSAALNLSFVRKLDRSVAEPCESVPPFTTDSVNQPRFCGRASWGLSSVTSPKQSD